MKVVTQIIIAFLTILVGFGLANAIVYQKSSQSKNEITRTIQESQNIADIASELRQKFTKFDGTVAQLGSIELLGKFDNIAARASTEYQDFRAAVASSGFQLESLNVQGLNQATLDELEFLLTDIKYAYRQVIIKQEYIYAQRNELENLTAASDLLLKKAIRYVQNDEYLVKDIEAVIEKRTALVALNNRILFESDYQRAQAIEKQIVALGEEVSDDLSYLSEEVPLLASEKDFEQFNSDISNILYSKKSLSSNKVDVIELLSVLSEKNLSYDQMSQNVLSVLNELNYSVKESSELTRQHIVSTLDTIVVTQNMAVFICCLGVCFIAYFLVKRITSPIQYVLGILEELVHGNYSQVVKTTGWSTEFQILTQRLEDVIRVNESLINNVKSASVDIQSQSHQNHSALHSVTESSIEQKSMMDQISTAVEELDSITSKTNSSVEQSSTHTEDVKRIVVDTFNVVNMNVEGNNILKNLISDSVETITCVASRSDEISQIISVIDEIANQTNLLALNAAIESARAGEYGRGFAVVADEVRNLAQRTSDSTQQIQAMIENLQLATKVAVGSMSECETQMTDNLVFIEKTKNAMSQIEDHMNKLTDESCVVLSSSHAQSVSCSQISTAVDAILDELEESVVNLERVSESSERLALLTTKQQEEVAWFRTNC